MTGMTAYDGLPTLCCDMWYSNCHFSGVTADSSIAYSVGTVFCNN